MNEEKLKQILNQMGNTNVPPNAVLIAERASRNVSSVLKIQQPRQWFAGPVRLAAAAAVIILVFAMGRWSWQIPVTSQSPKIAVYAQTASAYPVSQSNPDSFWQQKAIAAMKPRPYTQTSLNRAELINAYKQYFKE
jgi:hypothetical protein